MEKHNFSINYNNEILNFSIIIDSKNYSIPYSVFIYKNKEENEYTVYETDEKGYIQIGMSFDNKEEAISEAIDWKIGLFYSLHGMNSNITLNRKKEN